MLKTALFYGRCALIFLLILEVFLLFYELYQRAKKKENDSGAKEKPVAESKKQESVTEIKKPLNESIKEKVKTGTKAILKEAMQEAQKEISIPNKQDIKDYKENTDLPNPKYGKRPVSYTKGKLQKKKVGMMDDEEYLIQVYDGVKEAAEDMGVSRQNIYACIAGDQSHAAGYKWRYVTDKEASEFRSADKK